MNIIESELRNQSEKDNLFEINCLRVDITTEKVLLYKCDICNQHQFENFGLFMDHFQKQHPHFMHFKKNDWGVMHLYKYELSSRDNIIGHQNRPKDWMDQLAAIKNIKPAFTESVKRNAKMAVFFSTECELRFRCEICEQHDFMSFEELIEHCTNIHEYLFDFRNGYAHFILNIDDENKYKESLVSSNTGETTKDLGVVDNRKNQMNSGFDRIVKEASGNWENLNGVQKFSTFGSGSSRQSVKSHKPERRRSVTPEARTFDAGKIYAEYVPETQLINKRKPQSRDQFPKEDDLLHCLKICYNKGSRLRFRCYICTQNSKTFEDYIQHFQDHHLYLVTFKKKSMKFFLYIEDQSCIPNDFEERQNLRKKVKLARIDAEIERENKIKAKALQSFDGFLMNADQEPEPEPKMYRFPGDRIDAAVIYLSDKYELTFRCDICDESHLRNFLCLIQHMILFHGDLLSFRDSKMGKWGEMLLSIDNVTNFLLTNKKRFEEKMKAAQRKKRMKRLKRANGGQRVELASSRPNLHIEDDEIITIDSDSDDDIIEIGRRSITPEERIFDPAKIYAEYVPESQLVKNLQSKKNNDSKNASEAQISEE